MHRKRLPTEISFVRADGQEIKYDATIGFYTNGRPGEIFIGGAKDGTEMSAICADGSVLISIALQYGVPIEVLVKAIGRAPITVDGPPVRTVSVLGAAIDEIAKQEIY